MTELVSEKAIRQNQSGKQIYCDWALSEVLAATDGLLKSKDSRPFQGGPYSRRVTIIFTDEITIPFEQYRPLLLNHCFAGLPNTDEAYFLFSYNGVDRCPYVRLQISN